MPDHVFPAPTHLTAGYYKRNLADTISGIGGADASVCEPSNLQQRYAVDEQITDVVLQFIAEANYLANVINLRWNGNRGVPLTLRDGSELPQERWTDSARQASILSDRRMFSGAGGRFLSRAGTELGIYTGFTTEGPNVVVPSRIPTKLFTLPKDVVPILEVAEILQSYVLMCFDLRGVAEVASQIPNIQWPSERFCELILGLRHFLKLVPRDPFMWASMAQLGYSSIDYDHLIEKFEEEWDHALKDMTTLLPRAVFPSDPNALGVALQRQLNTVNPLRMGPVIRLDGNFAVVDLASAAEELQVEADFISAQGEIANIRSKHFESVVQRAIDATPWFPPEPLRPLIGRTIRFEGRAVTDIDAVATKESRLMIVSVKSLLHTSEYREGTYRALRNATTTVVNACSDARDLEAFLRQHPKGDNYDFTEFSTIIVVVCLPYVVDVPLGPATEPVVDELLAAVSLTELRRYLLDMTITH